MGCNESKSCFVNDEQYSYSVIINTHFWLSIACAAAAFATSCAFLAASVIFLKFSKNDPSLLKLFFGGGGSSKIALAFLETNDNNQSHGQFYKFNCKY